MEKITLEDDKRAFAAIAFNFVASECQDGDEETPGQGIVRMTLNYVTEGLMDWQAATLFLEAVFKLVGGEDGETKEL